MTTTKIWMPLYIADYLADTTRLTTEQHGADLLLIMDYWRNGAPPDDDHVLANITGLQVAAWKKHRAAMARMFQIEGGEWRHKRIDLELAAAESNAAKYAERAKKAAAKRWGKDETSNALGNASSMPQAIFDECTTPSSSSLSIPDGIDKNTVAISDSFAKFWDAYPKKVGKQAAEKAFAKVKRPAETLTLILKALAWQCASEQWQRDGGQYIPNPATYINQGRWDDEQPSEKDLQRQAPARTSRHSGFEKINYREGINADGTFA